MHAIRTEGLTKHYSVGFWRSRPYVALDSLNLEVASGEIFGFLGPNGAGKTTTLKLLMQLIFPTAGHADGYRWDVSDTHELLNARANRLHGRRRGLSSLCADRCCAGGDHP